MGQRWCHSSAPVVVVGRWWCLGEQSACVALLRADAFCLCDLEVKLGNVVERVARAQLEAEGLEERGRGDGGGRGER